MDSLSAWEKLLNRVIRNSLDSVSVLRLELLCGFPPWPVRVQAKNDPLQMWILPQVGVQRALVQAAQYCRAVYDAGFAPICTALFLPLFLNDAVPEEHKSSIDIGRDLLRRSRVLVVCGHTVTESMKNDIAVAQRLGITATTLEGILTVKGQGRR